MACVLSCRWGYLTPPLLFPNPSHLINGATLLLPQFRIYLLWLQEQSFRVPKYSSPSVLIWKAKRSNFLVVPPEILRETVSYKKKKEYVKQQKNKI